MQHVVGDVTVDDILGTKLHTCFCRLMSNDVEDVVTDGIEGDGRDLLRCKDIVINLNKLEKS